MNKSMNVSWYRWVILIAIVPIIISTEIMWLSLAPIATIAEKFYSVDGMYVSLFSMSYMIMFIIFSIPASYVIDRYGYRQSLIFGAVLTAVFSVVRAIYSDNFTIVIVSQFIIAIGQPFLLNISTKVPANWFPKSERSTATGILIMAQYLGFALAMFLAPILAQWQGISGVFNVFAIITVVSAFIAIMFTKEKPKGSILVYEDSHEEFSMTSLKKLIGNKNYLIMLLIGFISIGIFNTILTLIDSIIIPRGLSIVESGTIGGVFVVSGIIGAIVIPIISDKLRKKVSVIILALSSLVPLYIGITFIPNFITLAIVSAITGFIVMGVAPVLFEYSSEVAYPVKEGISLGVMLLSGQISGVLFVFIFELILKNHSVAIAMMLLVSATAIEIPFALLMKENK